MGLLEGSGRGGKGADGTQREVHQRHGERDGERRRGTATVAGMEGWRVVERTREGRVSRGRAGEVRDVLGT